MNAPVLIQAVLTEGALDLVGRASPVAGGTLTLVVADGLAALASLLPAGVGEELFADPEAAAELSLRHHELLTALAVTADLAPVRLGALHADEASAARMLRDNAATFRQALARIAGAQEYAVKLTPLLADATPAPAEPPASGRSFLQRRAEAGQRRRDAGGALDALRVHAAAHVFAPPRRHAAADQEKRLVDAALLVPRAEAATFAGAVPAAQDAAAAAGFRLSVRGPLPAYSFVGEAA
jgi:hypothetical protein